MSPPLNIPARGEYTRACARTFHASLTSRETQTDALLRFIALMRYWAAARYLHFHQDREQAATMAAPGRCALLPCSPPK